jgi:hypothetical protein
VSTVNSANSFQVTKFFVTTNDRQNCLVPRTGFEPRKHCFRSVDIFACYKKPGKKIHAINPKQVRSCTAYGIRTRVTAVKGRRPKPLDERGISIHSVSVRQCVKYSFNEFDTLTHCLSDTLIRGAERIRTAVRGFADLCLTTRPQRRMNIEYPTENIE